MKCPKCHLRELLIGQVMCDPCWDKKLREQRDDEQMRKNFPARFTPQLPYTTRRPGHVKH